MSAPSIPIAGAFPPPLESYQDQQMGSIWAVLIHRAQVEPLNVLVTVIFLLAIIHTFFAPKILRLSHRLQQKRDRELTAIHGEDHHLPDAARQSIPAAILHFLGEVEAVFGLWAIPLAVVMMFWKGPAIVGTYLNRTLHFTEPLFVVVIMAIAASRPIVKLAETLLEKLAGESPSRWWLALLMIGPLLGSVVTEPAAMTICAVLLGREFYSLRPSQPFMYATLGLLFVNVSVGGALTNFAAPPVLMVAAKWNFTLPYMLEHFGVRIVPAILFSTTVYFLIFRQEFLQLTKARQAKPPDAGDGGEPVPIWITFVHLGFLAWTVQMAHQPALFIGGFLFFLAFTVATSFYQEEINMRGPLLVGFFLAGLVIHGGVQAWWIQPVLGSLSAFPLLVGATILTSFNDNAAITYLASLGPELSERWKDAVVSGAICGGGLTVIANAPNPAGQSLLQKYFPEGISPGGLFLAALGPTLVMLFFFALPR